MKSTATNRPVKPINVRSADTKYMGEEPTWKFQPESERRLRVLSRPVRVRELGQPRCQPTSDRVLERLDRPGPSTRVGIVELVDLDRELQQPCETVRTLPGGAPLAFEVGDLGEQVLDGE